MNIALKQLKVFVTVAQERTITAAAEKLFLSKPAVSMALSELEKQLDHKLFDRNNNRLLINEQGKRLLPLADELLARSNTIEKLFDQEDSIAGELKIGSSDTVGNQLTPFLIRDFRSATQHHHQKLFISNTALVCQKLSEFELDVGFVEGKVQHPDLIVQPWLEDQMVVACHPEHPLTQIKELRLADLEDSEWVLRESGSGTREFFLNRLAPRLEHWTPAFELNTTEAIINSVAAGLGITCISQRAALHAVEEERIVLLPMPLDMRRQYWLIFHKEKYQSPLLESFIQFSQQWTFD
ncbi:MULTISPECIES: LysR substrate-binding domain-containing protein [unclassified Photobacterium]|uniref:LysR substrate-binding domain-containing protein n=1 Tax=unclassified Photobacterium TaxID=2628852 RepID=UPI001EE0C5B8|nr:MULTISPECIES: LysR substrate-binding domain-containing protein [unclassified Photobacterium]MCG3865865.1 LysR family transcriptional regulator [Photobacterium sp. Ph6]MCG3877315.1 LysR family transcriptional regulator [Photobacterium sp. Ph5]